VPARLRCSAREPPTGQRGWPAGLTDFPRCGNNAPVIRGHRFSRISGALLLAAVVALAPGCSLFGDSFLPEQPLAEVTVVGEINIDRATVDSSDCAVGSTILWGIARNTGDLDVNDVFIEIDALDANNSVIGTYRVHVFNGEIAEITPPPPSTTPPTTPEEPIQVAGTSLAVDQSGTFEVCARLSAGSVAGTAYRTDFIIVSEIQ
jgi:hypothetical protein